MGSGQAAPESAMVDQEDHWQPQLLHEPQLAPTPFPLHLRKELEYDNDEHLSLAKLAEKASRLLIVDKRKSVL